MTVEDYIDHNKEKVCPSTQGIEDLIEAIRVHIWTDYQELYEMYRMECPSVLYDQTLLSIASIYIKKEIQWAIANQ